MQQRYKESPNKSAYQQQQKSKDLEVDKQPIFKKSHLRTFTTQVIQLNQHFMKILSCRGNCESSTYPQIVASHVDRVKHILQELVIVELPIDNKNRFNLLFEFWEHLLYVCNYGLIHKTTEILFNILHQMITLQSFHKMAILLLKKEAENTELLSVYHRYKILCRETFLVITQLFYRFEVHTLGEDVMNELCKTLDSQKIMEYAPKITSIISQLQLEQPIAEIFAALGVIDKDILLLINEITETQFDRSTTICHYNAHFLMEYIPDKKAKITSQVTTCVPLLLLYPSPFSFIIHFLPVWIEELEQMNIKEEQIVKTTEYLGYKKWLYDHMGENMRKFESAREAYYLSECIKGFLRSNNIEDLNQLIHIIKGNTNIYNTKQMVRMARMIEGIMDYYVSLHNDEVMLFDNDFNIEDFIQIVDMTIAADHTESMLKMLGIIYTYASYFIGNSRTVLLHDYILNKRFVYFFFHWSDLIRNAFSHIILYRILFVKEKNLVDNKLSSNDLSQYAKRTKGSYDPKYQDLIFYTAKLQRMEMTKLLIDSIPKTGYTLNETKMTLFYRQFQRTESQYQRWLMSKLFNVTEIPHIQTSFFWDK